MKVRIIILSVVLILSMACRKNRNYPVPSVALDVTIDINLPSYSELAGVGGWAYVNGGSRGVIVYRRATEDFVAFDRHSPLDEAGDCATPLTPSEDNFLELLDACSEGKFSLYDGSPIANSEFGLRRYQTLFNGNNLLRIYN